MSYTLLRGSFVTRYADQPRQGPQPDGDTVKLPDNPGLVEALPRPSRADPVHRDDALFLLETAEHGNMHDVVSAAGHEIRLTRWPGDLVISPDPACRARGLRSPPEGHDTRRQITEPLQDGTALMALAPSIVAGLPSDNLKPIGFPGHDASRRPLVVGGDIAVVPVQPGRSCDDLLGAKRLVDLLTEPEAISLWGQADGGYLTPSENPPFVDESGREGDDLRELLTAYLRLDSEGEQLSDDDPVYFDLSDNRLSVPELGGSQASSAFMAQFHADVTSHRVRRTAVDWLVTQLASAYRGRVPDGRQSDLPSCRGT